MCHDGDIVGNVEDDTVSIVDTATHKVTATKGTPLSPQRIIISRDGHFAYVLTRMGGVVGQNKYTPLLFRHAINDKHELNLQVPVAQAPWGLAVSDDEAYFYVSSNSEDTIQVVDRNTFKVLNSVKVNKDPQRHCLPAVVAP